MRCWRASSSPSAGTTGSGASAGDKARLIAINEGRLLDFLAHSAYGHRFAGLRRFVLGALDGQANEPERACW